MFNILDSPINKALLFVVLTFGCSTLSFAGIDETVLLSFSSAISRLAIAAGLFISMVAVLAGVSLITSLFNK